MAKAPSPSDLLSAAVELAAKAAAKKPAAKKTAAKKAAAKKAATKKAAAKKAAPAKKATKTAKSAAKKPAAAKKTAEKKLSAKKAAEPKTPAVAEAPSPEDDIPPLSASMPAAKIMQPLQNFEKTPYAVNRINNNYDFRTQDEILEEYVKYPNRCLKAGRVSALNSLLNWYKKDYTIAVMHEDLNAAGHKEKLLDCLKYMPEGIGSLALIDLLKGKAPSEAVVKYKKQRQVVLGLLTSPTTKPPSIEDIKKFFVLRYMEARERTLFEHLPKDAQGVAALKAKRIQDLDGKEVNAKAPQTDAKTKAHVYAALIITAEESKRYGDDVMKHHETFKEGAGPAEFWQKYLDDRYGGKNLRSYESNGAWYSPLLRVLTVKTTRSVAASGLYSSSNYSFPLVPVPAYVGKKIAATNIAKLLATSHGTDWFSQNFRLAGKISPHDLTQTVSVGSPVVISVKPKAASEDHGLTSEKSTKAIVYPVIIKTALIDRWTFPLNVDTISQGNRTTHSKLRRVVWERLNPYSVGASIQASPAAQALSPMFKKMLLDQETNGLLNHQPIPSIEELSLQSNLRVVVSLLTDFFNQISQRSWDIFAPRDTTRPFLIKDEDKFKKQATAEALQTHITASIKAAIEVGQKLLAEVIEGANTNLIVKKATSEWANRANTYAAHWNKLLPTLARSNDEGYVGLHNAIQMIAASDGGSEQTDLEDAITDDHADGIVSPAPSRAQAGRSSAKGRF